MWSANLRSNWHGIKELMNIDIIKQHLGLLVVRLLFVEAAEESVRIL